MEATIRRSCSFEVKSVLFKRITSPKAIWLKTCHCNKSCIEKKWPRFLPRPLISCASFSHVLICTRRINQSDNSVQLQTTLKALVQPERPYDWSRISQSSRFNYQVIKRASFLLHHRFNSRNADVPVKIMRLVSGHLGINGKTSTLQCNRDIRCWVQAILRHQLRSHRYFLSLPQCLFHNSYSF